MQILSMTASLLLLIATKSMMSYANRLKLKPGFGPLPYTMVNDAPRFTFHPAVNLPRVQMQVETWSNPSSTIVSTGEWRSNTRNTRPAHQTFPPTAIYGMDVRRLLQTWADSFAIPVERKELHSMVHVLTKATTKAMQLDLPIANASLELNTLEMVGLIPPKDFQIPFLESGSSAVDASVLALGLFLRKQIEDDQRGSLRDRIEEEIWRSEETRATKVREFESNRDKKHFDVFAIEGLAEAPGLTDDWAKALLSKLAKYAHKEHKFLVVSKQAYFSRDDRTELTPYYVRLGFEKVLMEGGLYELVYMGAEDTSVEKIMIGMDLWTGV